jgi:deazaflavin-dependent oxidoreductase (nitroreductase family)
VLETQGARSGARRRNAIIYVHDGDLVTIAASNAGDSRHPAWYHNLRAHPDVTFGGIPMRLDAALVVGSVAITLHHYSTHHARHAAPETGNSGAEPTFAPTRLPPPRRRRGRHLENRRPHENSASGRCGHRRADRPIRRRRPHLARIHQIIVSGTQGLRNTAPRRYHVQNRNHRQTSADRMTNLVGLRRDRTRSNARAYRRIRRGRSRVEQ